MRKRRSSRHVSGVQWRRVNRRALRLAAFSVLLPVPVALAAPQTATLPTEQLVAMSQVPVRGIGDTVLPRVLPVSTKAAGQKSGPAASVTRVARSGEKAAADAPSKVAANGIPAAALRAYRTAEATMSIADPSCGLSWGLLAGIGRVESDHGRYGGAVLGNDGTSTPQILGLPLNGVGPVAAIADTDNGELDGDTRWDRAVGPLQFIPSTWAMVGVDGDGDGNRDPHDIDDAALAAAAYLCVGDNDLSTPAGVSDAVYSYNHSADYVALVTGIAHAYASGAVALPLTATLALPTGPGVTVGLNTGHGVPIGATDDVSSRAGAKGANGAKGAGKHAKKSKTDAADESPAGGKKADRRQPGGGSEETDGTTGPRQRPGNSPADDSKTGGRTQPPATGGGDPSGSTGGSGNGGDEKADEPEVTDPVPPADDTVDDGNSNEGTGSGGGQGSNEETEDPEVQDPPATEEPEAPAAEEPEAPEPKQDTDEGVLAWCDGSESTLCLEGNEGEPIDVAPEAVDGYAPLVGTEVVVIHQSDDDGETWYFLDIASTEG
jgi:membrane-bound lytic murein transglycosylase B